MVIKADPSRNYYADLKVSANASENEIRKAFRTLALQYHPDRNPGREAEFVIRFQEIQAAHEILCDAPSRAKYDSDRRKHRNVSAPGNTPNTPRTRPPPPPRNAHSTTTPGGTYYRAPPPRPQPQAQRPQPQHHDSYKNGADRFTNRNFRPPPTAQRPDAKARDAEARANVFTAWQKMKPQPRGEEPRQHNPTANGSSQSNAQNNPNGTPFGRSQSTRVPSSRTGFDPSTPGVDEGQARSAYRNYARPAPTPPTSTTPPKDSQADDAPYSEANRVRTPYYSHVSGERTSMFDGIGRSSSVRNSPTHVHRASHSQDAGAYSDSGRRTHGKKSSAQPNPFAHGYPDSSDEDSESEVFNSGNKHHNPPPPPLQNTRPPPPTWAEGNFTTPDPKRQSNGATANVPNTFKSRSEESINMKFSPSDWHGKFEGSDSYFAPNMQKGANGKGRASPTRGRSQRNATDRNPFSTRPMGPPQASAFWQTIPPPPPGPPPGINFALPKMAPHTAKFSPQDWQETFKDPNWVYNESKETSPRRASESTKRPKAARKASVQQNETSTAQEPIDVSRPKYQAFAEESVNDDVDAMDIDSGPPPNVKPAKKGTRAALSSPKSNAAGIGAVPNGSTTAPSSATTAKLPAEGLNGLGPDMINPVVEPQSNGLSGMGSLVDAIPFPSQASNAHPVKAHAARNLKYPEIPNAPHPPAKVDLDSANFYFDRMRTYAKSYRNYCKILTAHFASRNIEMEDLDDNFIHNRGETTKKLGFASYLAKMEEDEGVMETWKLAQERHITALQQCEDVRNKTMKLYQTLQT